MKKNQNVYDNVTHLTPMYRMLLEQQAQKKSLESKKQEEVTDGHTDTNSGKPGTKPRTNK